MTEDGDISLLGFVFVLSGQFPLISSSVPQSFGMAKGFQYVKKSHSFWRSASMEWELACLDVWGRMYVFIYLCIRVLCLHVSAWPGIFGGQKRALNPWNSSYRWLWATVWCACAWNWTWVLVIAEPCLQHLIYSFNISSQLREFVWVWTELGSGVIRRAVRACGSSGNVALEEPVLCAEWEFARGLFGGS